MRSIHGALLSILVACSYAPPADVPTAQLLAIHPPIANTGEEITLEGTFFENSVVHFPGGVVAPAKLLGITDGVHPFTHRVSVVVPSGVPAGDTDADLYVTTVDSRLGSFDTKPLPFRRAAFGPVQAFRADACTGQPARHLVMLRSFAKALVARNSLYVLGGANSSGSLDTIERAEIRDGQLQEFQVMDDPRLAKPRSGYAIAVAGEWLYLIGGTGDDTIERAQIGADGSLGPFQILDSRLDTPRQLLASEVIGNRLYVLGGEDLHIASAEIDPTGKLSKFFTDPEVRVYSAPTDRTSRLGAASAVIGDVLYFFGGTLCRWENDACEGTLPMGVDQSQIDHLGALSTFTSTGVDLGQPRAYFASMIVGKSVYLLGGSDAYYISLNSIEAASIETTASLGSFDGSSTSLANPRNGPAAAVAGNSVHVFGGYAQAKSLATVECAAIELAPQ